jgi:hypothetical protein
MHQVADDETQKKTERLHMLMSRSELEAIDDWRFKNRIGTRSDAIRRLCQVGLLVGGELEALTDVTLAMSTKVSDLEDEASELWMSIANPVVKGDVVDREGAGYLVEKLVDRIEKIEGAADDVSSVLLGLFLATAGLTKNDAEEGARISNEAINRMKMHMEKMIKLRAEKRLNRVEMRKYGFRKSQTKDTSQ